MHSCLLKVPIFQQLSEAELTHVHEFIQPKTYQKGEFIQHAGEVSSQLLILNRGAAKLARTASDGSEMLVRSLSPGDYIGDTAVFSNLPAENDTIATADSSFCALDGSDLHRLLHKYPDLSLKIIADLSSKLTKSETHIESLSLKRADDRVLQTLTNYSGGQTTFKLNTSKKDLASQIGMRPETFSRSLKQLQQNGSIKIEGKSISLLVKSTD